MIDADAGSATANSYVSTFEADDYFIASTDNAAWPASSDLKEAALQESTRILDSMFSWGGTIATVEQALRWPRDGVYDADGRKLASDTVPVAIKNATMDYAYYLLKSGGVAMSESDLRSIKIGPIDMKFKDGSSAVGVPPFIIKSLALYGTYNGVLTGSVYSKTAIRA